jgi:hypothetical protein
MQVRRGKYEDQTQKDSRRSSTYCKCVCDSTYHAESVFLVSYSWCHAGNIIGYRNLSMYEAVEDEMA